MTDWTQERIVVLLGGISNEREISLRSGQAVLDALLRQGIRAYPFDPATEPFSALYEGRFTRAFIALHGKGGEDGTMQGMLSQFGIPYTGSNVLASALALDKWRAKLIWQSLGIPTPEFVLIQDSDAKEHAEPFAFPWIIKPAREGSSIGVAKVDGRHALEDAINQARLFDTMVLAERYIAGLECHVAILDGQALPVVRVEFDHPIYDFKAKYGVSQTVYHCPAGLGTDTEQRIQETALSAFHALGASGWGRVDIRFSEKDGPFVLEVNTIPGMTERSLVPMAAKAAGISFDELCLKILESVYVE
jgi:D-alanine-D-alanine ligase